MVVAVTAGGVSVVNERLKSAVVDSACFEPSNVRDDQAHVPRGNVDRSLVPGIEVLLCGSTSSELSWGSLIRHLSFAKGGDSPDRAPQHLARMYQI
jgi:hypothetical protein